MPRLMAQLFHPSFNTLARVSILGGVFIVCGAFAVLAGVYRSPYITEQYVARGFLAEMTHPALGTLRLPQLPVQWNGRSFAPRPAP